MHAPGYHCRESLSGGTCSSNERCRSLYQRINRFSHRILGA
jgi:hypothetical protein